MTQFDQHSQQVETQYNAECITIQQQPPSLTEKQRKLNRVRMLQRVQTIWIDGVLKPSMQSMAEIALKLQNESNAVAIPLWQELQEFKQNKLSSSFYESIVDIYDHTGGEVLILGEPGAGKTTLLLELTRVLLDRAQQDEVQPLPVVFPLSSWVTKQLPLSEWLAAELHTRYHIPLPLATFWIETDQVLPLLDGLDEVAAPQRGACVEAINAYRGVHGLLPTVVCSRQADYFALSTRLLLPTVVAIQPLTPEQIESYLEHGGERLDVLRQMLHKDADLQELVRTPLMLNVCTVAYQQATSAEIDITASPGPKRAQIFAAYVRRMLIRRRMSACYAPEQTIRWLSYLAGQMKHQNQTIFYVEQMQPDWLPGDRLHRLCQVIVRGLPGFIPGLLYGFYSWLNCGSSGKGLLVGLVAWLLFGLASAVLQERKATKVVGGLPTSTWLNLGKGLLIGLGPGLLIWWLSGSPMGLDIGLVEWLTGGIFSGLFLELIEGIGTEIKPVEVVNWSWSAARRVLGKGLLVGLLVMLFFGLVYMLRYEFAPGLHSQLFLGLICGSIFGLPFGLLVVPFFGLFSGLSSGILDEHAHIKPNQGMRESVCNSMRVGLIGGLIVGLLLGPSCSFLYWLLSGSMIVGLMDGLLNGLIYGVIVWMAFGLRGGGLACLKHWVLRLFLWRTRLLPWNCPRFLDYAAERILLRKVGGGYIFLHRLLLNYFADLEAGSGDDETTEWS